VPDLDRLVEVIEHPLHRQVQQRPGQSDRLVVGPGQVHGSFEQNASEGARSGVSVVQAQARERVGQLADISGFLGQLDPGLEHIADVHLQTRPCTAERPREVQQREGGVLTAEERLPPRLGDRHGLHVVGDPEREGKGMCSGAAPRSNRVPQIVVGLGGPQGVVHGLGVLSRVVQGDREVAVEPCPGDPVVRMRQRDAQMPSSLRGRPERAGTGSSPPELGDRCRLERFDIGVPGHCLDRVEIVLGDDRRQVTCRLAAGLELADHGEVGGLAVAARQGRVGHLPHHRLHELVLAELRTQPAGLLAEDLEPHQARQHVVEVGDVPTQSVDRLFPEGGSEHARLADHPPLHCGQPVETGGDQSLERGRGCDRVEVEGLGIGEDVLPPTRDDEVPVDQ